MRSARLAKLPVGCIYSSFQAQLFAAVCIFYGNIIFSGAVDFQTGLGQGFDEAVAVVNLAAPHHGADIIMHRRFGLGPFIGRGLLAPADEAGIVQVGVVGGANTGAGRVIGARPVFTLIVEVAQGVKIFLPAGWKSIEGFARGKFNPGDDEMQFMVSGMAVAYPKNVVLVWFHACEGNLLKVVHQFPFLFRAHGVFRPPGADPGCELPFAWLGIYQVAGHVLIAAQKCRRCVGPAWIICPHNVIDRAIAATLAVRKNFYKHGLSVNFLMSACSSSRRIIMSMACRPLA
jgi:hypothetical protein